MPTVIDLSHVLEDGTITYPGLPGPVISDHLSREASRQRYAPGYEFHIGRIDMVANTGTYLDTPFHRYPDGHDLAGLDPARVAGVRGIVVEAGEDQEIPSARLDGLELAGHAVLFRTGWDRHWGTERYGHPDHPYLSVAATERLAEAGAAVVGIDAVNIDGTRTGERPVHSVLLGAGVPIVEHLTGLDHIGGRPFMFFAVPPAIRGMGTFPVRALAVLT
ncbi:MAG TPA: cyclase family protein [Acidimicrobiales bacterium]|jgi:arylformamidase|nr:cyclase family protein [Acidimicrobiales bacterium]